MYMNDEVKKAEGKVKKVTGKVTGNEKLEAEGRIEEKTADVEGKVKDKVEDVKQTAAGKANEVMDKADESK